MKANTFAEACYDTNSIDELKKALKGDADQTDMNEWGLTEEDWRSQVELALNEKLSELS